MVLLCKRACFALRYRHFCDAKQWVLERVGNKVVMRFVSFGKIFILLWLSCQTSNKKSKRILPDFE